MIRFVLAFILVLVTANAFAQPDVYRLSVQADFDMVYKAIYEALEENRLFVVFEPDIGSNMAGFAERWGDDYNRNGLDRIRSMVFCNPWWANQVANADPDMLVLCPLHLSLVHKGGETTVLFPRPDAIARGTPAESVTTELAETVIKAIEQGVRKATQ